MKAWVRDVTSAPDDATIVVTELACLEDGCPPFEVVLAVMRADGSREQRKVHRRLDELTRDDVARAFAASEHHH